MFAKKIKKNKERTRVFHIVWRCLANIRARGYKRVIHQDRRDRFLGNRFCLFPRPCAAETIL